jgi:hypothetical protein
MPACPDAHVVVSPGVLRGLLQLPGGWVTGEIRVRPDNIVEVDVVFPDGPTELPPVAVMPHYRRVWHADGKAIALDHVSVVAATPDRPRKRLSRG